MDDSSIIALYFDRDESAINETKETYGNLIRSVSYNILKSESDSAECENDTYLRAWESIPPTVPECFSAFLCKITRNLAINRLRDNKRHNPPGTMIIIDELSDSIPDNDGDITEDIELRDALNDFLRGLAPTKRKIFMKRYFYMREIREIAREMGIGVSSVKVTLMRLRGELRKFLEERGIVI